MPAGKMTHSHHGIAYLGNFSGSTMLSVFSAIPWARDGMLLHAGSVLDCHFIFIFRDSKIEFVFF